MKKPEVDFQRLDLYCKKSYYWAFIWATDWQMSDGPQHNPYPPGTANAESWFEGFTDGLKCRFHDHPIETLVALAIAPERP